MKATILHYRNIRGIDTITGPERYLLELFNKIDKTRFELLLALAVNVENKCELFLKTLDSRKIPYVTIPVKNRFDLSDVMALRKIIKERNVALIQTHDARSDFAGLLAAQICQTPIVAFAHGWVNWDSKLSKERVYAFLEAKAISFADRIIVASRYMQKDLHKKRIKNRKISYIPLGIDMDCYSISDDFRMRIRKEFHILEDTILIGTVGRIHPWKGFSFLIEAIKKIKQERTDVKLMIVGDEAFKEHLKYKHGLNKQVEQSGLNDDIIFTGSRNDISCIMNALDIFVLPSLVEPFGLVSIEAQACGRPVIGTNVGGIPETIVSNKTGILVEPQNSDQIAETILCLLKDKTKIHKMGQAGRNWVEKQHSSVRMAHETEKLYHMMLKA